MYRPSVVIDPRLRVAAGLIETIVPDYDIKQSDPMVAAERGVGNCVSKAVIGGILLSYAKLVGPEPALAWNSHTHPKIGDDMFGRTKIQNGHAQLLVAGTTNTENINAISFNPTDVIARNWEVYNFNDDDDAYAEVSDNKIRVTIAGEAVGFQIHDWHAGGKKYYEALGQENSVYHRLNKDDISDSVISVLKARDLLLSL